MNSAEVAVQLKALESLDEDWDGEGSVLPSTASLANAVALTRWALDAQLPISSIDPDALGGVGIYLAFPDSEDFVWLACVNGSAPSVIISENGEASCSDAGPAALAGVVYVMRKWGLR